MQICIERTKTMVISKELRHCKLSIERQTIEQVTILNYFVAEITSDENRRKKVRNQTIKGSGIASTLTDIFNNKNMNIQSKVKI